MANLPPREFDAPLTACPMCASSRLARFDHDYHKTTIDRCQDCGLLFMNPQYTDRYLADYYSRYIDGATVDDSPYTRRRLEAKSEAFRLIGQFQSPGKFLAVGCGDGIEIELARQFGWDAEGFDVDAQATQRVAKRLGAKIHTGNFLQLGLPSGSFDCVFMDQVLEHPKNPQEYLREVHRLLRPDGVLFIGCPNIRSISSIAKTVAGRLGLKRRRGKHYDTWHHLFYYSPKMLSRIIEQYFGFTTLAAEGDPFTGQSAPLAEQGPLTRAATWLQRKVPALESTFRLVCRKRAASATNAAPRRQARAA